MEHIKSLSESTGRKAFYSLIENCPEQVSEDLGLKSLKIADADVVLSKIETSIMLNRTAGLGTQQQIDPTSIHAIAQAYRENASPNFFLHLYDEHITAEVQSALDQENLIRRRSWMKFHRDPTPPNSVRSDLVIQKVGFHNAQDFGRIVCSCFGMNPASIPLVASLANDPRWHLFLSYDGDTPAGTGALFIEDKCGWLDWASTDPNFRSRGSQSAIMAKRIEVAIEHGCKHLFTETGEEVPGDPQHSYKNITKAGFSELVLRANYGLSQ